MLIEAVESENQIQQQINDKNEIILELEDTLYSLENNVFQRYELLEVIQIQKQLKTISDCDQLIAIFESNIRIIQQHKVCDV